MSTMNKLEWFPLYESDRPESFRISVVDAAQLGDVGVIIRTYVVTMDGAPLLSTTFVPGAFLYGDEWGGWYVDAPTL